MGCEFHYSERTGSSESFKFLKALIDINLSIRGRLRRFNFERRFRAEYICVIDVKVNCRGGPSK